VIMVETRERQACRSSRQFGTGFLPMLLVETAKMPCHEFA
jgi:hypothetical protein